MRRLSCCRLLLLLLVFVARQRCRGELRLLQIIGMIQLFRIGQRMRRKYSDFVTLPPPHEQQQVELYPAERGAPCASLSQCFMSGFYRPNKEPNHLPTAVHKPTEPELQCPELQAAASRLYEDSDEGHRIVGENGNLYEYWSANSGLDIKNPTDARELYERLQLERSSSNGSLPSWADRFWPELKRQSDLHFAWLAKSRDLQKMAAGPLLGLMIVRMEKHMDGHDRNQYFVYSGKNSSLAGLLALFGAFDGSEPPFGSTLVLEMHRFGAVYYVRVLYFYKADAPEVVTLRGCSEYCPFDKFKLLTTGMVPFRWQHDCGMWESGAAASSNRLLFFAAGLTWLLLMFVY